MKHEPKKQCGAALVAVELSEPLHLLLPPTAKLIKNWRKAVTLQVSPKLSQISRAGLSLAAKQGVFTVVSHKAENSGPEPGMVELQRLTPNNLLSKKTHLLNVPQPSKWCCKVHLKTSLWKIFQVQNLALNSEWPVLSGVQSTCWSELRNYDSSR